MPSRAQSDSDRHASTNATISQMQGLDAGIRPVDSTAIPPIPSEHAPLHGRQPTFPTAHAVLSEPPERAERRHQAERLTALTSSRGTLKRRGFPLRSTRMLESRRDRTAHSFGELTCQTRKKLRSRACFGQGGIRYGREPRNMSSPPSYRHRLRSRCRRCG